MKLYFPGTRHATFMRGKIELDSQNHQWLSTTPQFWMWKSNRTSIQTLSTIDIERSSRGGVYRTTNLGSRQADIKFHSCNVKTGNVTGDIIEDEIHAIYHCPSFAFIRCNFTNLLEKYPTIGLLLNPEPSDIYEVASLLSEIDDVLSKRWNVGVWIQKWCIVV